MENIDEQSNDKKKMKHSSVVTPEADFQLVDPKDARIRYLERQVYLLRRIVDAQKDYASERDTFTSSYPFGQSDNNKINSFSLLPNIVVKQILQQIPDQKTLLKCRLISSQWNQLIQDTSELMRKITIPIWHPKLFMDLDIVKKKKVKSIKLMNTTQLNPEYFNNKEFIDLISETVEKVEFAFVDPDMPYQCGLFQLFLEKCDKLVELIINCKAEPVVGMFRSTSLPTINIAAGNILRIISINVGSYEEDDGVGLSSFLLKLPNLQEIHINGCCGSPSADVAILTGLCEYIKNYDTKLRLKKLTLALQEFDVGTIETEGFELLILTLILCERYSIVILDLPCVSVNYLLGFTGSTILPESMLQQRPLFTNEIDVEFIFDEDSNNLTINFDRLQFLIVRNLYIYLDRGLVKPEELGWIKEIRGLKSLYMEISYNEIELELLPSSIAALRDVFSAGLPFLKEFQLKRDVFGTLEGFPWLQCFANLNTLVINDYKEIPNDLISQLTVLEYLTTLKLDSLENLMDQSFTIDGVNKFAADNGSGLLSTAPAIVCFKQLKVLKIENCNKLTEVCLSEGITKNNTLDRIEIKKCLNLKENCSKLVKCKCEITVSS